MCLFLCSGCATKALEIKVPGDANPQWFSCVNVYDCVAVIDSYCEEVAVHRDHALRYLDWTHEKVKVYPDRRRCEVPSSQYGSAICRDDVCGLKPGIEDVLSPKE